MTEATIGVRLQARASRDELVGVRDGLLQARVGEKSREKLLRVDGIEPGEVEAALAGL